MKKDVNKSLLESKTLFLSVCNHFVVGFCRVYRCYMHDIFSTTMLFLTKIRTKSNLRNYCMYGNSADCQRPIVTHAKLCIGVRTAYIFIPKNLFIVTGAYLKQLQIW